MEKGENVKYILIKFIMKFILNLQNMPPRRIPPRVLRRMGTRANPPDSEGQGSHNQGRRNPEYEEEVDEDYIE